MIAYWFSRADGTTDYQRTPAADGHTDTCEGQIVPCEHGLHGSPTPWDALQYGRDGTMMWEVKLPDDAVPHGKPVDKHAAPWRTYRRHVDLTDTLRQFARSQAQQAATAALQVADKWDMPASTRTLLETVASGGEYTAGAAWGAANAAWGAAYAAGSAARAAGRAANAAWHAADAARGAAVDARGAADAAGGAANAAGGAAAAADAAAKQEFNEMAMAALNAATTEG